MSSYDRGPDPWPEWAALAAAISARPPLDLPEEPPF